MPSLNPLMPMATHDLSLFGVIWFSQDYRQNGDEYCIMPSLNPLMPIVTHGLSLHFGFLENDGTYVDQSFIMRSMTWISCEHGHNNYY